MRSSLRRVLIIQTAFIGDVILATVLIEQIRQDYPEAQIDFLLRKGNEGLLEGHPHLKEVLVWNKKEKKLFNLLQIIRKIRQKRYDLVINLQRFGSSGLMTILSGAKQTVGFDKNPFSRFFHRQVKHSFEEGKHEVERNLALLSHLTPVKKIRPVLYPQPADQIKAQVYKTQTYICIAPTSVWFTKQWPAQQWIAFINTLPQNWLVYLLGGPDDWEACEAIREQAQHPKVHNLAGELSLLASAALMKDAHMNYVNDSAPMHLASAMNAPVCAVYCSTIPAFGFGPLSEQSTVIETREKLACRPCGLHGHRACPEGHFKCAKEIEVERLRVFS